MYAPIVVMNTMAEIFRVTFASAMPTRTSASRITYSTTIDRLNSFAATDAVPIHSIVRMDNE
ncbi:hypothetical protein ASG86_14600 [Arthrobacter sp. Soil764]|nr:hypothetical protein ASG86_14600 [Arthrobacter sp. Soil764]